MKDQTQVRRSIQAYNNSHNHQWDGICKPNWCFYADTGHNNFTNQIWDESFTASLQSSAAYVQSF